MLISVTIDKLVLDGPCGCLRTEIESLKASIRAHGWLEGKDRIPLGVCAIGDGNYRVLEGRRRVTALRELEWTSEIVVDVRSGVTSPCGCGGRHV